MKTPLLTILTFVFTLGTAQAQIMNEVDIACKDPMSGRLSYTEAHVARFTMEFLGSSKTAEQTQIIEVNGNFYIKADVFYPSGWGQALISLENKENRLVLTAASNTYECIPSENDPCIYNASIDNNDVESALQCSCVGQGKVRAAKGQGNFTAVIESALELRDQLAPCGLP